MMIEHLTLTFARLSNVHMNALFLLGLILFAGAVGGRIILRKYAEKEKILVFSLCGVLFALGAALIMEIDMLLAAMTMGIVLVNFEPRLSKDVFNLTFGFATPFYILFFFLVGAKFDLTVTSWSVVFIALLYILGRTFGKTAGANLGAKYSGAPVTVQKYLPYCLFSQAGVAIGLSILASQIFPGAIGNSIIAIVTLTTFIVQLLGPPCVKYAVVKAKENGLNITEDDILRKTKICQIIDKNPPFIEENIQLKDVLKIFSKNNYHNFPVVNTGKKLKGVITLDSVKQSFAHAELGDIILAHDIMEPVIDRKVSADSSLLEAGEIMNKYGIDYLTIVDKKSVLLGFVEKKSIDSFVSIKLMEIEQKIASMA